MTVWYPKRIVLASLLALATVTASCEVGPLRIGPPTPTAMSAVGMTSTAAANVEASSTAATARGAETPTPASSPRATTTALAAHPSPTVGMLRRQPEWTVSELIQNDKKQIVLQDGTSSFTVATVDAANTFDRWGMQFTIDLTGDGVPEAVVFHYTGGAHCCSEYLIYGSEPSGIRLYDAFSLGNAGLTSQGVKDLDGDGIPELQTGDDRFAYFADVPYAASPRLPLVLCRSAQGTYQDCTPKFPQILLEYAGKEEQLLDEAVKQVSELGNDVEKHGAALGVLVAYMRAGQEDQGWSSVKAICPDCEAWLRANLSDIRDMLAQKMPAPLLEPLP